MYIRKHVPKTDDKKYQQKYITGRTEITTYLPCPIECGYRISFTRTVSNAQ